MRNSHEAQQKADYKRLVRAKDALREVHGSHLLVADKRALRIVNEELDSILSSIKSYLDFKEGVKHVSVNETPA